MRYTQKIFRTKNIYDLEAGNEDFTKAIIENVRYHQTHCAPYAQLLHQQQFSLDIIHSVDDLYQIPAIPTAFFKNHTWYSADPNRLLWKSTSSGTSGKKSEMGFDYPSFFRFASMALNSAVFTHKLVSVIPANYIILGYEPAHHNHMGAVKTANAATFTAPALHKEYALKDTGTGYQLNLDGIKQALLRYNKSLFPVRIVGFPAYFLFLLRELQADGIKLQLHPKSLVMLGGGWKQFFAEEVSKEALYALAKEVLGIHESRIHELFGVVEHSVAYFDCPHHHFHVPAYARVIIRDTNMNPLGYGEPGLLNLITPMFTSVPFTSIITDDLAILHPGESCGCGLKAPYFEILGRVGQKDLKTCAAKASDLLL